MTQVDSKDKSSTEKERVSQEVEFNNPELTVLANTIQNDELLDAQQKYLISRLLGQIDYMENKAVACKKAHLRSRMFAICGGVLVTTLVGLSAYSDHPQVQKGLSITAFLVSQMVTISTAVEQLKKNNELWMFYRRSGEFMKSQLWQFIQLAGPYEGLSREKSLKSLIRQAEEIIPRDLDILTSQNAQDNQQNISTTLPSHADLLKQGKTGLE